MKSGSLTQKVKFTDYALVPDGAGGFIETTEPNIVLSTFASVRQIKATREAEAYKEAIKPIYELKLRKRDDFNPKSNHIVVWREAEYTILSIEEEIKYKDYWALIITKRGDKL